MISITRRLSLFLFCLMCLSAAQTQASPHVSILQYHHVSDTTPAITSISVAEFAEHMQYLAEFHTVVSLEDVQESFSTKTPLPDLAVAITFDDGYKNILENAHPILKKHGFAYTIFINPAQIGGSSNQLNWDEIKQMSAEGVTFANHTVDHAHLLTLYPNENQAQWESRIQRNIDMAERIITEQVGYSRKWLAYPFGEFDDRLKEMLQVSDYLGFGQQSGASAWYSDQQALPRFPASGKYADLDTLITKLRSLAMPVLNAAPSDPKMKVGTKGVSVELDIVSDDFMPNRFACYYLGDKLDLNFQNIEAQTYLPHPLISTTSNITRFNFDTVKTFYPGRSRVNCTAPSISKSGRFYWYSIPFFTATEKGEYLD